MPIKKVQDKNKASYWLLHTSSKKDTSKKKNIFKENRRLSEKIARFHQFICGAVDRNHAKSKLSETYWKHL